MGSVAMAWPDTTPSTDWEASEVGQAIRSVEPVRVIMLIKTGHISFFMY
jgi:hypothetical protein